MQKILVPLDGSPLAQHALTHAMAVARREDAELLLLGVDEQYVYFSETERLTDYLGHLCERLREAGWRVHWRVMAGGPAEMIVTTAEQQKVDLVVMSSHGRRGVTRWFLGSVTERIAREMARPLLVVRCSHNVSVEEVEAGFASALTGRLPEYARVLVPLDGTSPAEAALAPACKLVGSRLNLLAVVDFPPPIVGGEIPSGWAASVERESETERHRYLVGVSERLPSPPCEVQSQVRRGAAADEIVEAAAESDLIVMTSCSRPWLERVLSGSIASRVARHAPCPVLLIPGLPVAVPA